MQQKDQIRSVVYTEAVKSYTLLKLDLNLAQFLAMKSTREADLRSEYNRNLFFFSGVGEEIHIISPPKKKKLTM